jgi:hypothetical protein
MTITDIDHWFSFRMPTAEQITAAGVIRNAARALALVILEQTPKNADQTAAMRQLRECVMTATAAIHAPI